MNTEKELLELEKRFWQALKAQDVSTAIDLTDFPCIVTGPQGIGRVDRSQFEKMMTESRYTIKSVDLEDVEVRLLKDDVAVVAYKVHEAVNVDGESIDLHAADSSTWIRRDGRWRCAQHSEAIMGDAFGRARRAARPKTKH